MAGTIVADQLQNGAGASTSTTDVVNGSARAWAKFNGSAATIYASYNVSSITKNSGGDYTVNFTNSLTSSNYAVVLQSLAFSTTSTQRNTGIAGSDTVGPTTYSSSQVRVVAGNPASASLQDTVLMCIAVFG
jgi:hypothetical protein